MKKWHKILGIILFSVILLVGIFWQWIYIYSIRDLRITYATHDCKNAMYIFMGGDAIILGITYFAALFFFICLWRKGDKR